jgi:hypothetical protein
MAAILVIAQQAGSASADPGRAKIPEARRFAPLVLAHYLP